MTADEARTVLAGLRNALTVLTVADRWCLYNYHARHSVWPANNIDAPTLKAIAYHDLIYHAPNQQLS